MSEHKNRFCAHCGAKLEPDDIFCVNCGAKVERSASSTAASTMPPEIRANENNKSGNKLVKVLVTAAVVALAYFGGQLLGGQMAGSFKTAQPTPEPFSLSTPKVTLGSSVTLAPIVTVAPNTGTGAATQRTGWNAGTSTDLELHQAMDVYFSALKNESTYCSLFMDSNGDHGGFFYTDDRNNLIVWTGSWDDSDDSDDHISLIDETGIRHIVYMRPVSNDAVTIVSAEGVSINMTLNRGDLGKEDFYDMLLKVKNG